MGGVADFAGDLIGGAGDLVTGALGISDAPENAAQAQLQGIRESNQLQRELFNAQTGLNAFQRGVGNQALNLLAGMYGIQGGYDPAGSVKFDENGKLINVAGTTPPGGGTYGTGAPDYSAFLNSPDYQFALEQGQLGLDRAAAAGGGLFSGGRMKEASRYNQGMATQQLGNFQNRLASLAGIGTTANNNVSNSLMNAGNNISQGLIGMGDARASGYINQSNMQQNALGNLLGFGGAIGGALLCDRRLKTDIERVGEYKGHRWYKFKYLWGQPGEGPMADEVMQTNPGAVHEHPSGFLMVDLEAL